MVEGIKADAARMDSSVLPLALLVMALVVHNLPLMIVPILTIPVALLAQFLVRTHTHHFPTLNSACSWLPRMAALEECSLMASVLCMQVMYPVACHVDVVSFAPSLMMSLTIAMGIDYNLFQATRFMDGVRAKLDLLPAVTLMLQSAGQAHATAHGYGRHASM